jgi:hypothetical protein
MTEAQEKAVFGTFWKWLARKDSPDTSVQAAKAVDSKGLEKQVYDIIVCFKGDGCIQDDVLNELSWLPYSSVTARFAALKRKGLVQLTGEKRLGRSGKQQAVMVAVTNQGN